MNEDEIFEKRLDRIMLAYSGLVHILLRCLPVPIGLPPLAEGWSPTEALKAVHRSRTLIRELGLDSEDVEILDDALMSWTVAFEIGVLAQMTEPTEWRLDAMRWSAIQSIVAIQLFEERNPATGDD